MNKTPEEEFRARWQAMQEEARDNARRTERDGAILIAISVGVAIGYAIWQWNSLITF